MNKQLMIIGIILILLTVGLSGCTETSNTLNPITNKFIGDWDGGAIDINIYSNGTVKYRNTKDKQSATGTWGVNGDILTFDFSHSNTIIWRYAFSNNDQTLTLTVTLTGQKIVFTKQ